MSIEVYKPLATRQRVPTESAAPELPLTARRAPNVAGQAFAVMHNSWQSMYRLADAIADRLLELGATNVVKVEIPHGGYPEGATQQASPGLLDSIAGQVTGAVFGLGN